jgi:hypothetical protein
VIESVPPRARRPLAPALAALTLVLTGCSDLLPPHSDEAGPRSGPTQTSRRLVDGDARARELLTRVRVVATRPDVPGYDRDCGPGDGCVFGPEWDDATSAPMSRNGCDTRNDVLARDLVDVRFSERSPDCDVTGGTLVDPYTGDTLDLETRGSEIHVDHLFPLAAAWDLGASGWSAERRARFANDPDGELLAVSGSANLAKGDSTPASWLPPRREYRCTYVTDYLEVADGYDLAVTAADVRVIEDVLRKHC